MKHLFCLEGYMFSSFSKVVGAMKFVEIARIELGHFPTDTRLYSFLLLNHLGINCQPVKFKTHQDANRKSMKTYLQSLAY